MTQQTRPSRALGPSLGDRILRYTVLTCATLFILFPYFWMLLTTVKPTDELMLSPATWLPKYIHFSNYQRVWHVLPLLRYFRNTVIVAVTSTSVSLTLTSMAAFSLSCYKTKLRGFAITLLLTTQLIPFTLPLISFYRMMYALELTNTYTGLILAYTVWAIPFGTLMLRGYYTQAIPPSLIESARIDGCSRFGTFWRIGLPLARPGIVATMIFSFILAWNDFAWASIILVDNKKKPVSIAIHDFIGQFGGSVNIALTMTTAVLITIPVMVLFIFLQKHLVSGLTSGAVKG